MSGVLRWENPPAARRQGRRPTTAWHEVAAELRTRPGEWGVIYEGAGGHALVGRVEAGKQGFTPAGGYEVTTRGAGISRVVYARFVGEPAAEAGPP